MRRNSTCRSLYYPSLTAHPKRNELHSRKIPWLAAFVRHPTLVLWLERDDHGTEGAATMSLPAKDTPAGRLTAAAITGVATIVVGSCDDAADLERRFGVDRDRVKLADEYLSALPVLGVGDGHEPAAHGPEGQG